MRSPAAAGGGQPVRAAGLRERITVEEARKQSKRLCFCYSPRWETNRFEEKLPKKSSGATLFTHARTRSL